MHVRHWLSSVLVVLLATTGCSQDSVIKDPSTPEAPGELIASDLQRTANPGATDEELRSVAAGNTDFGAAMYRELIRTEENLFFSPLSITQGFSMVYVGARGNTEAQMQQALRFSLPQERLHPAMNALDLALHGHAESAPEGQGDPPELRIVNATWGQKGYTFESAFLDVLGLQYGAGMHAVDFASDPNGVREQINAWVAGQTNDRIQDLLPEGSVKGDSRLVLTNALYFKGAWTESFEPGLTRTEPFSLLEGGTQQVQMMHRSGSVPHMRGDGFDAVALNYVGKAFRMLVIVPDSGRFKEVEARLSAEFLDGIRPALVNQHIDLGMPKFQTETDFSLADPLQTLGMVDAFSTSADFSGITQQERLMLTSAWHKAFVAVDEKGTEAAAATGAVAGPVSIPPSLTVDRPFLFLIEDVETKTVLFLGRILKP
ncbi:MAG TPA: serpin family protein [Hyalangium sp.]|nr:serpin family protein [Hyalangium sp.]